MFLFSFRRKARRRDKDVGATGADESKQYLEDTMLECVAAEYKLREIVNLPDGVDLNEWLASHSKFTFPELSRLEAELRKHFWHFASALPGSADVSRLPAHLISYILTLPPFSLRV